MWEEYETLREMFLKRMGEILSPDLQLLDHACEARCL